MSTEGDLLHTVTADTITDDRRRVGRAMVWGAGMLFCVMAALQFMHDTDRSIVGFSTWRPVLFAYLLWATALCAAQVIVNGEKGKRTLFVLPAALFVISLVVFPLLFALYVSFTDWNLASLNGPQPNGWDNMRQMWGDAFYWNALKNTVYYVLAVSVEYVIAFGLALLLNAQIRARKFFRVVFLLPLMLSPVAVSWMVGKSMLEVRFGPVSRVVRELGFEPSFFGTPEMARFMIMAMDAWTFIPFMMIMLLAGLQALPREVIEASKVDGATGWQSFREVIFPLMLPVSVTAIVIRIIFKLKLADIIINVTSGGPGGATDSVTSFIFREYRDRSNVGYGTLLAIVYLVLIVIFITALLKLVSRWMERPGMTPVFKDHEVDRKIQVKWWTSRIAIYTALITWAIICLFPIFWTITTSFKLAPDVMRGNMIPWWDFTPKWKGWESLGLSPRLIGEVSTVREEFLKRFWNSAIVAVSASTLAVILGSLAAYGLSRFNYRFGFMRNSDISFFFLSQMILPPVVLALPFLVLYKSLDLLDSRIGLILLYTLMVLPIVIWIMRDQFQGIPVELEEAALVDGLGIWGAFVQIVLPIALPGMVAAFILSLVLCWNEYFFAALLTSTDAKTLPVMVASQTGSQGINWWSMAALSSAAILPLVIVAIFLEKYIIKGMAAGAVK